VYAAGALTKFYTDTFFDEVVKVNSTLVPIDNTTSKFAGTRTYYADRIMPCIVGPVPLSHVARSTEELVWQCFIK
jgi:hypothetical protein